VNLVVFDLETTGVDVERDEIIQIGAVCVDLDTGAERSEFEVKIKPSPKGEASLLRMQDEGFKNSYDSEIWASKAVPKALGLNRFAGYVGRYKDQGKISKTGKSYYVAQGCGYNAAKFDHPLILNACRSCNIFLPMNMLCWDTLQLAMFVFHLAHIEPPDFKLSTVAEALEIPLENAHDALADVRATAQITLKLMDMVKIH
jgi:DNA polymerase III epsilon subunit-like protein